MSSPFRNSFVSLLILTAPLCAAAQHWSFLPVKRTLIPPAPFSQVREKGENGNGTSPNPLLRKEGARRHGTSPNPLLRKEGARRHGTFPRALLRKEGAQRHGTFPRALLRKEGANGATPNPLLRKEGAYGNPVDLFVLAKLREKGLSLSPAADRRTIIRRVTYDLTGLPPSPEETAAFLADGRANAYDRVVDRLLASPRFGERWAQHWLDVARFAESNGYEHDLDRTQAWRYRDWVVNALNADLPYDRFLQMQIAGDLIQPDSFDARVATGFLRCGPFHITGGNLDPAEMRQEWLTEAVAGIGNGVLGLTVGCARCHDHKYDPITQKEYYGLQAFFAAAANDDHSIASDERKKQYDDAVKAIKERMKPIEAQVAAIEKPYRETIRARKMEMLSPEYRAALAVEASKRTPAQKKVAGEASTLLNISWDEVVDALSPRDRSRRAALRQQLFAVERETPDPLPESEGVGDVVKPAPAMHVLIRGDVHNPGAEVQPGFPSCLGAEPAAPDSSVNPRLRLAKWISSPENALTARVFVNRVWHYLFGRGLVATPNDFGRNGRPPTHPELLDWLAAGFAGKDGGSSGRWVAGSLGGETRPWSIKSLIRLLVTSDTYLQACQHDEKKAAVDPDNTLLWRANRRRLDAEEIRDSVLAAARTLNLQMGGPSIRVPLEPEVYDTIFTESEPDNLWPATRDARQHTRRSLYLFRKRNVRLPMLALFDQPDLMSSCAARGQTVHALQALTLVNGDFMRKQSYVLAKRLFAERPASDSARIDRLFALALGRPATDGERKATARFLSEQTALIRGRIAHKERLDDSLAVPDGIDRGLFLATADLCLATLNLNEFVYVR